MCICGNLVYEVDSIKFSWEGMDYLVGGVEIGLFYREEVRILY